MGCLADRFPGKMDARLTNFLYGCLSGRLIALITGVMDDDDLELYQLRGVRRGLGALWLGGAYASGGLQVESAPNPSRSTYPLPMSFREERSLSQSY